MNTFLHAMVGDLPTAIDAVAKTAALFLTAALLFRFMARRTMAEFAPFDWIGAVAAGAIVGRSATASDISWLSATAALVCLLLVHQALTRLRFVPSLQRLVDPPPQILVRDGKVIASSLRKCGLTMADLQAVLRRHGHCNAERIHLAVFESSGAVSILVDPTRSDQPLVRTPLRLAVADANESTAQRPCRSTPSAT